MTSYASMKLKMDTSTKSVDLGNNITVEILKYLPVEEKYNLIEIALQKSLENGIYNPIKLDMYFSLYLVYLYSNISFTDKQKEDELKIYDNLKSTGILEKIVDAIEDSEYNDLYTMLVETEDKKNAYSRSVVGLLNDFSSNLNNNADSLKEILSSFKPEDYQNVLDFAQAANGNRPIE